MIFSRIISTKYPVGRAGICSNKLIFLNSQDEEKATNPEGCDDTLKEASECRVSGNPSVSYGESSSDEVDSSTESLNSASTTSSHNDSASSTETETCLLEKEEKTREETSSNYQQPEIGSVLVAPRKPTASAVSNEQHCKLSKEEKIRIRKLRKKLATAASAADKEAGLGKEDTDKVLERHHYQPLNFFHEKEQQEEKPISDKNLVGYKMFGKLSCVNCMDVLRDCCGGKNF